MSSVKVYVETSRRQALTSSYRNSNLIDLQCFRHSPSSFNVFFVRNSFAISKTRLHFAHTKAYSPPLRADERLITHLLSISVKNRLVVGSANGDLRNLCAKVGTMQAKHGPFDILFCTGNFFGQETPIEVIDELLENKLDCKCLLIPLTMSKLHEISLFFSWQSLR